MPYILEVFIFTAILLCTTLIAIYFHFSSKYGTEINLTWKKVHEIEFDNDKRHDELIGHLLDIRSLLEDTPDKQKALDEMVINMNELINQQK